MSNAAPENGPGTHRTGFGAGIERGLGELFRRKLRRSQADEIGLGVARGILGGGDGVFSRQQNLTVGVGQQRAKGLVAMLARAGGEGDGRAEEIQVGCHRFILPHFGEGFKNDLDDRV